MFNQIVNYLLCVENQGIRKNSCSEVNAILLRAYLRDLSAIPMQTWRAPVWGQRDNRIQAQPLCDFGVCQK